MTNPGPSNTKGKATMSTSFRSAVQDDGPVAVGLDSIKAVTGQDTYNIWAATMMAI
jgi:hypothetical protein